MYYILVGFGGFLLGVVITCILLTKKNLETYKAISNEFDNNLKIAQKVYGKESKRPKRLRKDK